MSPSARSIWSAPRLRRLLAGIIPLDASASEADYRLCLLASFHTDRPGVIAAVLESSGLRRAKWRDHETYLAATIGRALARRQELANRSCFGLHTTQDSLRALIGAGNLPLAGPFPDPGTLGCALMGHFVSGGVKNRVVSAVLVFLLGVHKNGADSPFSRSENWIRVPVSDLAELLNVDRKTIGRALEKLDLAGIVERHTLVARVNGSPRCNSLVRLVAGMDAML